MAATVMVMYGRSSESGQLRSRWRGMAASGEAGRAWFAVSGEGGIADLPFWDVGEAGVAEAEAEVAGF